MDYLIREVSSIPLPSRPFLVLLGNVEEETNQVVKLAGELLGSDEFWIGSVAAKSVPDFYKACDLFALASLSEGFGRVYVEALASGIQCFAHDYPATQFIFGEHAALADLSKPGMLAALINTENHANEDARQLRHRSAYDRFSWINIKDQYVEMIVRCAHDQSGHRLPPGENENC
jgi:glycosyltransferase involved in cell wall biosynthesis